jgi:beta-barrel assembly-enhancing protease
MKCKLIARLLAINLLLFSPCQQAVDISKLALPDMGDSSGTLITPAEERELGEAFFRSLHSQIAINQDPEIQQYIQAIGEKLVASSDLPNSTFHFFVVMENDINAFAGPGGYIGVNSGLMLMTEAESELASVLGHEIAHVTQRHLYRSAESAKRMSIPTMAATLAAILLGSQSPQLGQAALIAIQAGSVQFQINFTREHEAEADRVGMQNLAEAHYDPRSMPTFFERMQQSTRFSGQNVPEFLRTHPVTASRISDTRGRAETYPYKQYPDSLAYQLTKAKIRVLMASNPMEVYGFFHKGQSQGTTEQRIVARYGLGLIALSTQKHKDAEAIFQQLVTEYPHQSHYAAALARTALDAKDYTTALTRYNKLVEQFPDNDAIKLEYVTSLLKTGDAGQARKNLDSLNTQTQKLPMYWQLLAQTYGELNQSAESHRYMAEYYYASGQIDEAILQIKLAQRIKGLGFQLSSILSERLNFFNDEYEKAKRDQ